MELSMKHNNTETQMDFSTQTRQKLAACLALPDRVFMDGVADFSIWWNKQDLSEDTKLTVHCKQASTS